MAVKYMGPDEQELPLGETGELWIKGPNIFKGYLNNIEGSRNALTDDGFFRTGDIGHEDKDGNVFITDRLKELIKYKGIAISAREISISAMKETKSNQKSRLPSRPSRTRRSPS